MRVPTPKKDCLYIETELRNPDCGWLPIRWHIITENLPGCCMLYQWKHNSSGQWTATHTSTSPTGSNTAYINEKVHELFEDTNIRVTFILHWCNSRHHFNKETIFPVMGISITKIKWWWDHLIFINISLSIRILKSRLTNISNNIYVICFPIKKGPKESSLGKMNCKDKKIPV